MNATLWTYRLTFPALVGAALVASGCEESTTQDDVSDARQELREEQQETAETIREGREQVAEAQREAQPYTVNKPVLEEDAIEAREDVAEARQGANEDVRDQAQEQNAAAVELRTEEQKLAATKARDAYVNQAERALADAEVRIKQLEESASSAEGTAKDAIDRQLEALNGQHDRAEEAIAELKDAELASWQAHQENVRVAMQGLNTSLNQVR